MCPYITLADGTEITHSHIIDRDGVKTVEVHFERARKDGFDSAQCILPAYQWIFQEGFSDEEIRDFDDFLHHNKIYEGGRILKVVPNDYPDGIMPDDKLTPLFRLAIQQAIEETKAKGLPIARYDRDTQKPYLEYPDGKREYV